MTTGRAAMVAAADRVERNWPRPSTKLPKNGGAVRASALVKIVAKKYSFHAKIKEIKAAAAIPGKTSGSTMRTTPSEYRQLDLADRTTTQPLSMNVRAPGVEESS